MRLFLFVGLAALALPTALAPSAAAQSSAADLEALFWQRRAEARTNYTPADVTFMTGMIGHHAQALVMSRMAPTNGASRPVRTLAARIINAQQDEIETMQRWLRDRDEPVPVVTADGETLMPPGVADPHAGHTMTPPSADGMHSAGADGHHPGMAGGETTEMDHGGMDHGAMHAQHVADGTHARHQADGTAAAHHADGEHAMCDHADGEACPHDGDHASCDPATCEHAPASGTAGMDHSGMNHAGHDMSGHDMSGHADGMTMMDHAGMPGMLSAAQLAELEAARGVDFDRLFLRYMIQHHGGAIVMVDELISHDGAAQDDASFKLASDVRVDQATEIARMQMMLDAIPESATD